MRLYDRRGAYQSQNTCFNETILASTSYLIDTCVTIRFACFEVMICLCWGWGVGDEELRMTAHRNAIKLVNKDRWRGVVDRASNS